MHQQNNSTAVLLFNYSEKQKASLQKIAPNVGGKKLNQLIQKLNLRTKKVALKANLPFFQFDASATADFGEQLHSAYQNLFEQGFEHVIGISNDCPNFKTSDLNKTVVAFENNRIVLGPAKDGGLYLFGIQKNTISKEEFLSFSWQTAELNNNISQLIDEHQISSVSLETKADMDTVSEFQTAFNSHFTFLNQLKGQLLSFCNRRFKIVNLIELSFSGLTSSLRAPPTR